jgi:hypothetical protein
MFGLELAVSCSQCLMIGRPDQAYELVLKWSVATGAVLADLVRSWASRAQTNQATAAQLIPANHSSLFTSS